MFWNRSHHEKRWDLPGEAKLGCGYGFIFFSFFPDLPGPLQPALRLCLSSAASSSTHGRSPWLSLDRGCGPWDAGLGRTGQSKEPATHPPTPRPQTSFPPLLPTCLPGIHQGGGADIHQAGEQGGGGRGGFWGGVSESPEATPQGHSHRPTVGAKGAAWSCGAWGAQGLSGKDGGTTSSFPSETLPLRQQPRGCSQSLACACGLARLMSLVGYHTGKPQISRPLSCA